MSPVKNSFENRLMETPQKCFIPARTELCAKNGLFIFINPKTLLFKVKLLKSRILMHYDPCILK